MAPRPPKIAPTVLERLRVQAWLVFHASTPLRYVYAAPGSGKTTCAVLYARTRPGRVAFVTVEPRTTESQLLAALAEAAGCAGPRTYGDLVERLGARAPLEIIVDDVDNADPSARAILAKIHLDVTDGVTFIYLARSGTAVPVIHARSQGLVDVCDPALLAFDEREIERFSILLGRREDSDNIARLYEATHGWAYAVSGVCRAAAAAALPYFEALPTWQRENQSMIRELVADALDAAPDRLRKLFGAMLAGDASGNAERLAELRSNGLFVAEWDGRLTINPLVREDAGMFSIRGVDAAVPVAKIEMFGRFEMLVDGRPVVWARRRDRQIIAYLAMQPQGGATRAEIIAAFWPDADRHLAGQSLRSACSTIRRAIGDCAGRTNVEIYFRGDHYLQLGLDRVVVSARRFAEQCELGNAAYELGDKHMAFSHYRSAELLYRAPFLCGEPPAPWTRLYEEAFASLHERIVERLDELGEMLLPQRGPSRNLGTFHQATA